MNNYFTGDFHADSYLMYDYLSQLEMYTGNERSGDKFFTKQKGPKKHKHTQSKKHKHAQSKKLTRNNPTQTRPKKE